MGMDTKNVINRVLALGNNEFESGSLSIPANIQYTAGTLLMRGAGETFAIASSTDVAIAVLPFDTEKSATTKVAGIRALISGRVRGDMLKYNASPTTQLTPAQRDALRDYGIIAVKVTDVSQLDNQ
jgi:hypothetical protein